MLCPFFGMPSGVYYFHHVIMHHIENNVFPYDVSSTMHYQRDNMLHFLHYWLRCVLTSAAPATPHSCARYMSAAWLELPYYLYKRGRYGLLVRFVRNMGLFLVLMGTLWRHNAAATFWVFVAPYMVSSLLLMFGASCPVLCMH